MLSLWLCFSLSPSLWISVPLQSEVAPSKKQQQLSLIWFTMAGKKRRKLKSWDFYFFAFNVLLDYMQVWTNDVRVLGINRSRVYVIHLVMENVRRNGNEIEFCKLEQSSSSVLLPTVKKQYSVCSRLLSVPSSTSAGFSSSFFGSSFPSSSSAYICSYFTFNCKNFWISVSLTMTAFLSSSSHSRFSSSIIW